MRWILDSNVWIEAVSGVPHAASTLIKAASADWCGYSAISRLEVFGFPGLAAEDAQRFESLFGQFHEVPVSTGIIQAAIRLRQLSRIKTPDAIIAATALSESAELVTRNVADFQKVTGLIVIDSATL